MNVHSKLWLFKRRTIRYSKSQTLSDNIYFLLPDNRRMHPNMNLVLSSTVSVNMCVNSLTIWYHNFFTLNVMVYYEWTVLLSPKAVTEFPISQDTSLIMNWKISLLYKVASGERLSIWFDILSEMLTVEIINLILLWFDYVVSTDHFRWCNFQPLT